MKFLRKAMDIISDICMKICVLLLVLIVIAIFLQVIIRKMGYSVTWVDETTRYSYVLMILLGTVVVARDGTHIRVTSFIEFLPVKVRRITEIISYLLVAAMAALFAYSCYFAATKAGEVRFSIITAIKMSYFYYACAVAGSIVVLGILAHLADIIAGRVELRQRRLRPGTDNERKEQEEL